jgi:hypothetical protein
MIWFILAIILVAYVSFHGGFLLGRSRTRTEQGKLLTTALREIEFRDQIRKDSHDKRLVTKSGNKNPGKSRVRNMKWR